MINHKTIIASLSIWLLTCATAAQAETQEATGGDYYDQYSESSQAENAQAATPAEEPKEADVQPVFDEVDDATLMKYAAAVVELRKIHTQYQQELADVQDQEKALQLQKTMQDEMIQMIQSKGLDLDTYNQITEQMRVDEDLLDRFNQMTKAQES